MLFNNCILPELLGRWFSRPPDHYFLLLPLLVNQSVGTRESHRLLREQHTVTILSNTQTC